jgi:uncharacterized RDD family membrane protein YckC
MTDLNSPETPAMIQTSPEQRREQIGNSNGIVLYAGFWRRLLAILIDEIGIILGITILIGVLLMVVYIMFGAKSNSANAVWAALYALPYILYLPGWWLYCTLMESSRSQATLGKMALGIVVTDLKNDRIGFGRANGRFWSKIISTYTLGIGFIMASFTKKKQALHDKIAGTLVVRKLRKASGV